MPTHPDPASIDKHPAFIDEPFGVVTGQARAGRKKIL
jgi:hypothetical protein